jgi:hypothetical protein
VHGERKLQALFFKLDVADNAYGFCCGCCLQNPMEQKPRDFSEILLTEKNIHVAEL